jgi:pSer/pThr/pTyr-binding forkhead associated (FHA) protein
VETESPLIYVVDLKKEGGVMIGRSLENAMVINDLSVSRKHCRLQIDRVKK